MRFNHEQIVILYVYKCERGSRRETKSDWSKNVGKQLSDDQLECLIKKEVVTYKQ